MDLLSQEQLDKIKMVPPKGTVDLLGRYLSKIEYLLGVGKARASSEWVTFYNTLLFGGNGRKPKPMPVGSGVELSVGV